MQTVKVLGSLERELINVLRASGLTWWRTWRLLKLSTRLFWKLTQSVASWLLKKPTVKYHTAPDEWNEGNGEGWGKNHSLYLHPPSKFF